MVVRRFIIYRILSKANRALLQRLDKLLDMFSALQLQIAMSAIYKTALSTTLYLKRKEIKLTLHRKGVLQGR